MATTTLKMTNVERALESIAIGEGKVRSTLDLTGEELFWMMIELGSQYARNCYPVMAEKLIGSPIFWAEFRLWWNANNNRFLSQITIDDLTQNGVSWACELYMSTQLEWLTKFYTISRVVADTVRKS